MRLLIKLIILLLISTPSYAVNYCNDANNQGCFLMEDSGTESNESTNSSDGITVASSPNSIPQDADKKFGTYSRDFESVDSEYLTQTDSLSTDISGADQSLSITAWVKHESDTGSNQSYVSKHINSNGKHQYHLYYDATANAVCALLDVSYDGSGATIACGATDIVSAGWTHVAIVYNDTDIRIYINGSLDSNGADNPKAYTAGIYDGSQGFYVGNSQSSYFDGLMDDVGVFNRALSSGEVSDIYTNGLVGSATGLKQPILGTVVID